MKKMVKKSLVLTLMLSPMMVNTVWADEAALTQRLERLERIVKGQGLVSLSGRVDQLQNEIQRLNGENEALIHQIETMKKRQRELYLDLDQRLQTQTVAPAPVAAPIDNIAEPINNSQTEQTLQENVSEIPEEAIDHGEAAYQAALQALRSGQHEEAVVALLAFPEKYPQSSYLPNAYYWQGEANYVLRHYLLAIDAFQTVIDRYPDSRKVADATLKQGFSQYELGQVSEAKATLANVIELYPDTSASRLAKVRLDQLKQEEN